MAYRHLAKARDVAMEKLEILQIQVMSGIDTETFRKRHFGSFDKRSHSLFGIYRKFIGIRLGVKLHTVSTGLGGKADIIALKNLTF